MRAFHQPLVVGLVLFFALASNLAASELDDSVAAFVKTNCVRCHVKGEPAGELNPSDLKASADDPAVARRWRRVFERVFDDEMPPESEPRPDAEQRKTFLSQLESVLKAAEKATGRSTLRPLNWSEYADVVSDLFEIRFPKSDLPPEKISAQGFEIAGDLLEISAEQLDLYLNAAEEALNRVFGPDRKPEHVSVKMPLGDDPFASRAIGDLFLKGDDHSLIAFQGFDCPTVFLSGKAVSRGTYRVQIQAKVHQSPKSLVMAVYAGDVIIGRGPTHTVGYWDVQPGNEWTTVTFEDQLEEGDCIRIVPYRLVAPTSGPNRFRGPGLMLGNISIEGPTEIWPPAGRKRLLGDVQPKRGTVGDARVIFERFLPRAFRRRLKPDEIEPFLALTKSGIDSGRPFLDSLRLGLKVALCSPEFLLRRDQDERPADRQSSESRDELLACRLSFFLWNSIPDDELSTLAASGRLRQPGVLREQAERLLRDAKSQRFVEQFTGKWLGLNNLHFTEPDAKLYPEFDEILRGSLITETHLFFREILDHDRSLLEFIDSDWTFLNERLAVHYGIKGVSGQSFEKVSLPADSMRGGILTQASILKVTANGTTTSPVVRGVWLLNNLVGQPVPPPPVGVPAIDPDLRGSVTIRDQLEKHRRNQECAICHDRIDPLGMVLENFDPIGGWRGAYRSLRGGKPVNIEIDRKKVEYRIGPKVDPATILSDGATLADIRELKRHLLGQKRQITRNLAEKVLTFALGREMGVADRRDVSEIVTKVAERGYGFRTLIHEIVQSPLFLQE